MCPSTGVAFEDPAPHTFSFNSPQGACPRCSGLGVEAVFDITKIIPDDSRSLNEGAIEPFGKYKNNKIFTLLTLLGRRYDFTLDDPVNTISEEGMNAILYGDPKPLTVDLSEFTSISGRRMIPWEGIAEYVQQSDDEESKKGQKWREQFLMYRPCSVCGGSRLKKEALQFRIGGKNIAEVLDMTVAEAYEFFGKVPRLANRLKTLVDVGLGYLGLGQPATTLSGGEAQRIKLATELSRRSTGKTLYLLDEPTTGLHFDDIAKLMTLLLKLRDAGNTVVVIEHNIDVMRCADWIIDLGPGGGDAGGTLVCEGPPEKIKSCKASVTGRFL
jgi:excinuclease ABC subunit A